ncbi:MAG: putative hydrophobic protein (TIGR00271 family) [Pirellulaceae bacterium]|jgi:uncharacterized hydrophobic protein (TIGR00271 family)
MTTAILITDTWEIASCLPWAARIARARGEELLVMHPSQRTGKTNKTVFVNSENAPSDGDSALTAVGKAVHGFLDKGADFLWPHEKNAGAADATPVQMVEILCETAHAAVLEHLNDNPVSLLILPRHISERGLDAETELERQLFADAPCETIQLRPAESNEINLDRILVPSSGGAPSHNALNLAVTLARMNAGEVTALYVERNVDAVSELVGERIIDRIVRSAVRSKERESVVTKAIVSAAVPVGIEKASAGHGLVILGAGRTGVVRRWLKRSVTEEVMSRCRNSAVAILRPASPISSRLRRLLEHSVQNWVPQLSREQRISLVERVQGSSVFDFDFQALICLSTMIASLGLLQNSGAVTIGAMLVAPLMTPLIGMGLAMSHGNITLLREAGKAVILGFLLAFTLGFVIGWLIPDLDITAEMRNRCEPRVLDLLVAFVSGIAAAYALGRPNLSSALPGVAIAAALVPPIATAGITASVGAWSLSAGALLLFVTNIVAIILGTMCILWATGVRSSHEHGAEQSWTWRLISIFAAIALVIGIYEAWPAERLPDEIVAEMRKQLEKEVGATSTVVTLGRISPSLEVHLTVESPTPVPFAVAEKLRKRLELYFDKPVEIELETHLMMRAK